MKISESYTLEQLQDLLGSVMISEYSINKYLHIDSALINYYMGLNNMECEYVDGRRYFTPDQVREIKEQYNHDRATGNYRTAPGHPDRPCYMIRMR